MRSVQRKTTTLNANATVGQNASTTSNNPVFSQSVNVNLAPSYPDTPQIESSQVSLPQTSPYSQAAQSRDVTIEETQVDTQTQSGTVQYKDDPMTAVYQKLMNVYKNALLDDPQLTLNLIDQSGKIILNGSDLTELLAVMCSVDKSSVKVNYYVDDEETGCCGVVNKLNPIKDIDSIQINKGGSWLDLNINFNGIYNKMNDEFKVSLKRVLVKPAISCYAGCAKGVSYP